MEYGNLTIERLKKLFTYKQDTGEFIRNITVSNSIAGKSVGTKDSRGHLQISIDSKPYASHRLAWFYCHGVWPNEIDHINGIRDDNRIDNLRDVSHSVNMQNQRECHSHNKSSLLLGVSFEKLSGKYKAYIRIDGKQKTIGRFDCKNTAHEAYINEKRQFHEGCTI